MALPLALVLVAHGLRTRRSRAAPMLALLAFPCATQLACVLARWRDTNHVPAQTPFELYLLVALALPLAALVARAVPRRGSSGGLGLDLTAALALALTALVADHARALPSDNRTLSPRLQSSLLGVHVGLLAAVARSARRARADTARDAALTRGEHRHGTLRSARTQYAARACCPTSGSTMGTRRQHAARALRTQREPAAARGGPPSARAHIPRIDIGHASTWGATGFRMLPGGWG